MNELAVTATLSANSVAKGRELQRILSDGRPQHVAAEMLQPSAIAGRNGDVGVEVEPFEMGMARAAPGDDRRIGIGPDPHHQMASTRSGRNPAQHRRTLNSRQHGIVERQRAGRLLLLERTVQLDPVGAHKTNDPRSHRESNRPTSMSVGGSLFQPN